MPQIKMVSTTLCHLDIYEYVNRDGALTGVETPMRQPVPPLFVFGITILRLASSKYHLLTFHITLQNPIKENLFDLVVVVFSDETFRSLSERFGYGASTCHKCYNKVKIFF